MRRILSSLAVAGVLVTAACSDSSESTAPGIDQARAPTDPTLSCSPTDVRKSTGAVFGNGSTEADLAKLITEDNAGSAFATTTGFDIIDSVAALRAGISWDAAMTGPAATLTAQLFPCMDVTATQPATEATLASALGAEGSYQVRGGADGLTGDVLSWDGRAGIRAPAPWDTWLGARALFLGSPIATFATETSGGTAYDWSMVHAGVGVLDPAAIVALCADNAPDDVTGAQLRLQHLANLDGGNILPTADGDFLPGCTLVPPPPSELRARLLQALVKFALPAPLHASVAQAGGIGGLKGAFSPFEIVYGASIVLSYPAQPVDGTANTPLKGAGGSEIQVLVTAEKFTPWEGIQVHIDAVTNNGANVAACGNDAETDAAGIAHFPNLTINKAGGYFLVATTLEASSDPDVTAYSRASVSSDRFNLKTSRKPSPC